jgi:hypothetical protein
MLAHSARLGWQHINLTGDYLRGIGAPSHLCGILLMSQLDTPMITVPYKGTGPAMTDLPGYTLSFTPGQARFGVEAIADCALPS